MGHFEITSENFDEIYDKWINPTKEEIQAYANVYKYQIVHLAVADIELLQDSLIAMLSGPLTSEYRRRVMQMGYGLEHIKNSMEV